MMGGESRYVSALESFGSSATFQMFARAAAYPPVPHRYILPHPDIHTIPFDDPRPLNPRVHTGACELYSCVVY